MSGAINKKLGVFYFRGPWKTTYSGHCDKHVVDAVSIAEVWIMGIFKIFPRISRILHQMTKAGGRQNLEKKQYLNWAVCLHVFLGTLFIYLSVRDST